MNDEQYFLANAYVDGELTVDERRIAEADPEVMTEVETLRALQAELREVPPPLDGARESAINAAMAEFTTAASTVTTPVVPLRPRPAYAKYLGIAAALVAVAGLGIVLSRASRGDDDASDAEATAEATFEAAAIDEGDAALTEAVDAGGEAGDGASADRAEAAAAPAEEMADEMADDAGGAAADMDVGEAELAPNDDTAGPAVGPRWEVPFDFDVDDPIVDEMDLGVFAVYLLQHGDAQRVPLPTDPSCAVDDEILGVATLVVDDRSVPVYVSVVENVDLVFARDVDTCEILLVGSLVAR